MIKDSAAADVVIVWKLDRFSRNRYDSAYYKMQLKKNGVRVLSAKENISDRPEGILLESMLEGHAEFYSAELSEKITRGIAIGAVADVARTRTLIAGQPPTLPRPMRFPKKAVL